MLQARLFLHLEWGLSCGLQLQVEEQSHLVLRLRFLLVWLILLLLPLLCPARPAISSVRRSPALAGVAVARPAMGPVVRRRSVLGIVLLPLVILLAAGRSPIGLFRSLPKMTEPRLLLPFLDVRLEVLLAILAPLRRVTARLVLALRAGSRGRPRERSGIAQGLAVVCPPCLRVRRTMTVPVPWLLWTLTGMTLSGLSWPSSGTSTAWKSRRMYHQLDARAIYVLMSETSLELHLPTSPLMRSLLDDTNLASSKYLEGQTVQGFLPVPSRRHRRYYRTSSSSFPGPYSVPPGVTSITLEKVSEARKRSVSLSASQVSSMETMLSGIWEVSSWLDWWLSTCGGFRENLPVEVRADFERLIFSQDREPWSSWLARAARLSSSRGEIPSSRTGGGSCALEVLTSS